MVEEVCRQRQVEAEKCKIKAKKKKQNVIVNTKQCCVYAL